jgi:outer membrane receptor protein involved in Fe transport
MKTNESVALELLDKNEISNSAPQRSKLSLCIAFAISSASLLTVYDAQAATNAKHVKKAKATNPQVNVNSLQQQIDQLNQALEASKRRELELIQRGTSTTLAPAKGNIVPAIPESAQVQNSIETPEIAADDNKSKDLGEVTVRARPRLQKLKDVPNSTSVRTGAELQRELAMDLGDVLKRAGNVKWNYGNARTSSLSMRGIGQQAQTDAMDPSVGTVVDGVPYAYNPLTSFDHYDIDQIAVERGPGGTDGGKNYSVGRVNIQTRRPTFNREATYSATYGDYNTYIGDAALGGAVVDDLVAWRGAIHFNKADGATKNLYNTDQTWYNRDRLAGRIQFLITPTETFNALLRFDANPRGAENNNGNIFYTPTPKISANGKPTNLNSDASTRLGRRWFVQGDPDYTYANDYLNGGGQNAFNLNAQSALTTASKGGSAELNWDVGGGKLTSIFAVRDFDFQARNDEGTPFDISKNGGGRVPDFTQISEELKFKSNVGKLVDYTTGVYLSDRKMIKGNRVGFGADAGAWFANASQYTALDASAQGQKLMQDSLQELHTENPYYIHNQSVSPFLNTKWHITDPFSIDAGIRYNFEDRSQGTEKFISQQGVGSWLSPYQINGIKTGGFESDTTGNLTANALADANQLALADKVANKYFGTKIDPTLAAGTAYASLTAAQKKLIGTAKTLRQSNIGLLWDKEPGRPFKSILPGYNVKPTYKFNDEYTGYVSWGYNEKGGLSQTVNSVAYLVEPEKTNAFEIGLKSNLFNDVLVLNTDFFWTEISNYQQSVQVLDVYQTEVNKTDTYTAITGNVKGVRAYGVEIDGSVNKVIPYTSVNFSGSYNNAFYSDFKNSAKSGEWNNLAAAYVDRTGWTLPGAAKFTFSVSPEFRYPVEVLGKNDFHTSFTTAFTSDYRSDVALSDYSWIPSNSTTDISVGLGRRDRAFDVSLVGKNVFNNQTPISKTWNQWSPMMPQWFGVTVSGKF